MISHEALFQRVEIVPDNISVRGPVTDYVMGEMPIDLAAIRDGKTGYEDLARKHGKLLGEAAPHILHNRDPHIAETTQLDLLFMLGAYLPLEDTAPGSSFREAPVSLSGIIGVNATEFGLPRRMGYEQIIDLNSAEFERTGNMRTFLTGDIALDERDFYFGHFLSEPHAKLTFAALAQLVSSPRLHDPEAVYDFASTEMKAFFDAGIDMYRLLPSASFATLRQYLLAYPDGERNASGAFMPSVQLVELALRPPTEEHLKFIDESMPYFPTASRSQMRGMVESSSQGNNLITLLEGGVLPISESAKTKLMVAIDAFIAFRKKHYGMAAKHVPQAFQAENSKLRDALEIGTERDVMEEGSAPGTAGFNVPHVLGNSIVRLMELKARIEALGNEEFN